MESQLIYQKRYHISVGGKRYMDNLMVRRVTTKHNKVNNYLKNGNEGVW